jgi:hypothetical protein
LIGVPFAVQKMSEFALERTRHPMLAQRREKRRRDRDRPHRSSRLRLLDSAVPGDAAADPEPAVLPVDVAPAEREQLAEAHAGRGCAEQERPALLSDEGLAAFVDAVEQRANLRAVEDLHLVMLDTRPTDTRSRIRREVLPLDRVAEHLPEWCQRVRDRAGSSTEPNRPWVASLLARLALLEFSRELKPFLVVRPACGPVRYEDIDQLPRDLGEVQVSEVRDHVVAERRLVGLEGALADVPFRIVAEPL